MMMGRILIGLFSVCMLAACITETTGGLPEPAAKQVRVKAHLDLARGYINSRNFSDAKRALTDTLEIDNRSVEAYTLLALVYEAEDEPDLAERNYRQALRIDSKASQALNNYGTFLFRQGRFEDAIDALRQVVKDADYRARPQAYENLGLAELSLGNDNLAEVAFERALSLNPRQATSTLELGMLAFERSEYDKANLYYQNYRKLARHSARSHCLGLRLGQQAGNVDQVASHELALRNLFSDSNEARQCLAKKQ